MNALPSPASVRTYVRFFEACGDELLILATYVRSATDEFSFERKSNIRSHVRTYTYYARAYAAAHLVDHLLPSSDYVYACLCCL